LNYWEVSPLSLEESPLLGPGETRIRSTEGGNERRDEMRARWRF